MWEDGPLVLRKPYSRVRTETEFRDDPIALREILTNAYWKVPSLRVSKQSQFFDTPRTVRACHCIGSFACESKDPVDMTAGANAMVKHLHSMCVSRGVEAVTCSITRELLGESELVSGGAKSCSFCTEASSSSLEPNTTSLPVNGSM